jgi:phosphatidylserine/phosphatidylglycerophosphate/cardiolipin synthase-like enzyme
MSRDDWFLNAAERGNPYTGIDARHDGVPWTEGNGVELLVDGVEYFDALHRTICETRAGDAVLFTGLEGNADAQLLPYDGCSVGDVLAGAARRGVAVRGLVWRAHAIVYHEAENLLFSRVVNEAGGEVLLDQRIRDGGSHHQKLVEVRRGDDPARDVANVGGMDLARGRRDDADHFGDPQRADLNEGNYGPTPPWHDLQICVQGPAVDDVAFTFRERWEDPAPLDHPTPWRALLHRAAKQPNEPSALPPERTEPRAAGACAIQVLRTYPARHSNPYPFAPEGERSIARAYVKAFRRASRLIYLEDQYLWSYRAADELDAALRREPELLVVIVIPRHPDPSGRLAGTASALGREEVQRALYEAGGDRVAIYDLENGAGTPIYVHSKVCVVDDIWCAVGSDNLNRRSWTHDSEISCAVLDDRLDERSPHEMGSHGDRARVFARDVRLRLACEHAQLDADAADPLVDPKAWFDLLRLRAEALDAWHEHGCVGERPPGHLRHHQQEHTRPAERRALDWVHAHVLDPDGRPDGLTALDEL